MSISSIFVASSLLGRCSDAQGRVLHAHDMRDATEFKGKDLLLIGTSYSAEDIASQCWKYGTKSIAISHRTAPIGYSTWPKEIVEVPLLTKVVSNLMPDPATGELEQGGLAHFADGSTRHVDAIILCTGYVHHFPFLSDALRLNPHAGDPGQPKNKIWLKGLYRGVFWMPNPQLMHVGPHTGFFTFSLFDAQAWLVRDAVMGRFRLPDAAGMAAHDEEMCRKCAALEAYAADGHRYDHECINFQGDYLADLVALTDYPDFDVEGVKKLFFEWEKHKEESIMGFRDKCYKSVITGSVSPQLLDRNGEPLLWKDAMGETCESFGMWDLYDGNTRKLKPTKPLETKSVSSFSVADIK
jgi:trimethylamine monooxygenase